jgi:hypothetical protein
MHNGKPTPCCATGFHNCYHFAIFNPHNTSQYTHTNNHHIRITFAHR